MRVIHFLEVVQGGPATHLNELLPFQVKAYDHVTVFCPQSQVRFIECDGVTVVPFPDTGRSLLGILRLISAWRGHLKTNAYDIIHLHSSFAGFAGRVMPTSTNTKLVYCARGWSFAMDTAAAKRRLYALVERILSHRTNAIINISLDEQERAVRAGLPEDKCTTVHNGIADCDWTPLPAGCRGSALLFVGRYDRQKGVDILLDAMGRLEPLGYTLSMIGAPVSGKQSIPQLPKGVTDLGWRTPDEIQKVMGRADIVVMPSRWEGFGFVGAEAMRAGRPLVATAVGGLKELVVNGETGVLCSPNSAAALADAILQLSAMDLREVGRAGRRRYEDMFTSKRMFQQIDAIYQRVAKLSSW